MRRTLAVLVTTAALLVPATAASASTHLNASCNSGTQRGPVTHGYNGEGQSGKSGGCLSTVVDGGSTDTPPPPGSGS